MNVLGPPCMELILHAVSLMFVRAMIQMYIDTLLQKLKEEMHNMHTAVSV